jgi:hypothetical protein
MPWDTEVGQLLFLLAERLRVVSSFTANSSPFLKSTMLLVQVDRLSVNLSLLLAELLLTLPSQVALPFPGGTACWKILLNREL